MDDQRKWTIRGMAAVYFAVLLTACLALGASRASWLSWNGTLPDQFYLHGVAWNAGVAFGLGTVAFPGVLLFSWVLRSASWARPTAFASLSALLCALLPFWVLSTSLEYRNASTWIPVLMQETPLWGPSIAMALGLWWVLLAKSSLRTIGARCVAAAALVLVVVGGVHARLVARAEAETALPLEISPSAERRPAVIVVLVDTLRADHLSVYGHSNSTSPNVDEFAADSVVYERAYAHSPWTRPSCGALLTSRYPPEIGLRSMWDALPPDVPLLPQYMSVEGYQTAGIVSSVHISAQYGFDKGWDLLDLGTSYLRWTRVTRILKRIGAIRRSEVYPRYNAEQLTDRAIAWFEDQTDSDAPPFLYLHYSDPHAPYWPPADQDRWRDFASEEGRTIQDPPLAPRMTGTPYTPAEKNAMLARYDAEIAYFDDHFGRLIEYLRESDLYRDALIVLTSDHGEEFGEHGGWAHAHTLYNELLNVPLIVKYPEGLGDPGTRERGASGLIDVVPTIRDVIGASWSGAGFRGRSLLSPPDREERRFLYADNEEPSLRGAIYGDHKLIQDLDTAGDVVSERYYEIGRDFGEHGDGKVPPDVPLGELRGFIAGTWDRMTSSGEIVVDEDTLDELRALGYVE